ncbi:MAG TPA: heavy metal-associated domain-containing protein [Candidatus Nanoarchaeia archaeon]|nr:heavy metal-associated domain-containing protein [Candidatus Nanoarchaeia archaeon]
MKKATILIEGMHCASCASHIEKSLTKMGGATNIRVNVLMKKGYADCEDKVTEQDMKQAVKKAGYTATQVTFENT